MIPTLGICPSSCDVEMGNSDCPPFPKSAWCVLSIWIKWARLGVSQGPDFMPSLQERNWCVLQGFLAELWNSDTMTGFCDLFHLLLDLAWGLFFCTQKNRWLLAKFKTCHSALHRSYPLQSLKYCQGCRIPQANPRPTCTHVQFIFFFSFVSCCCRNKMSCGGKLSGFPTSYFARYFHLVKEMQGAPPQNTSQPGEKEELGCCRSTAKNEQSRDGMAWLASLLTPPETRPVFLLNSCVFFWTTTEKYRHWDLLLDRHLIWARHSRHAEHKPLPVSIPLCHHFTHCFLPSTNTTQHDFAPLHLAYQLANHRPEGR